MFDTLQIILWSITYLLIIMDSIREHKSPGIPTVAVVLNFSWEIAAVIHQILDYGTLFWGNTAWLLLDAVIFVLLLREDSSRRITLKSDRLFNLDSRSFLSPTEA